MQMLNRSVTLWHRAALGRILLIECSSNVASPIAALVDSEYAVVIHRGAATALPVINDDPPSAIILAGRDADSTTGDLCRALRQADALVPIVCVSEPVGPATVARLLDAGADDFIALPVDRIELLARLAAHQRKATDASKAVSVLSERATTRPMGLAGDVEIDLAAREVRVCGEPVRLGRLEFQLVEYLSRNAGIAISSERMIEELYGFESDISTERLEILVRRVRAKLGMGRGRPSNLVAVPGYGYRWERRHLPRERVAGSQVAAG